VSNLSWTGRSAVISGTRYLTHCSPEGAVLIETVVNGRPIMSALMNPHGIPAIAQGCRAGEATRGPMPPGDAICNAVAASDGIDPHPGIGDRGDGGPGPPCGWRLWGRASQGRCSFLRPTLGWGPERRWRWSSAGTDRPRLSKAPGDSCARTECQVHALCLTRSHCKTKGLSAGIMQSR